MTTDKTTRAEIQRLRQKGAANAVRNLRRWATGKSLRHTDQDKKAQKAIIDTVFDMALGHARPHYYGSAIPTGGCKTRAAIEATKELVRIGEPVGVIWFVNTKDQIKKLTADMGLRPDQFAVRVSPNKPENEEFNGLGIGPDGDVNGAPVLFTTQQYVEAKTAKLGLPYFGAMDDFHFQGKPRRVRIWDEGIEPAEPVKVPVDWIDALKAPLMAQGRNEARRAVDDFAKMLERAEGGAAVHIPDLGLDPKCFEHETDRDTAELLWRHRGHAITVRHPNYGGTVALFWADQLPPDLAPCLVLDASIAHRETYRLWETHRRGWVRLPSAGKDYSGLTVHLCQRGAGKGVYSDPRTRWELAWTVARRAMMLTGPVLIVHRLRHGEAFRDNVCEAMARLGEDPARLIFLTWGRHTATNDYHDFKHVILAGVLHYSAADYEGIARASAGWAAYTPLPDGCLAATERGEIKHHILQAAGRSNLRHSDNGGCPPGCTLTVIDSRADADLLRDIFPGAPVKPWKAERPLSKAQERLVAAIERAVDWYEDDLTDTEGRVYWGLGERLDWPPRTIVSVEGLIAETGVARQSVHRLLRDERTRAELAARGLILDPGHPGKKGRTVRRFGWPRYVRAEREPARYRPRLEHVRR